MSKYMEKDIGVAMGSQLLIESPNENIIPIDGV